MASMLKTVQRTHKQKQCTAKAKQMHRKKQVGNRGKWHTPGRSKRAACRRINASRQRMKRLRLSLSKRTPHSVNG